jgi:hypothetical protein
MNYQSIKPVSKIKMLTIFKYVPDDILYEIGILIGNRVSHSSFYIPDELKDEVYKILNKCREQKIPIVINELGLSYTGDPVGKTTLWAYSPE